MVSFVTASKEAQIVIERCFDVQKDQNVGILTDEDHIIEARALAASAVQHGANVVILDASAFVQAGMQISGIPEPPDHIVGFMEKAHTFILKTDMDFAHRFAHTEAARIVERHKGRIASVEEELGTWGITMDDILQTKARTEKVGAVSGKANKVHITSDKGTDVTFSIKDRPPLVIVPIRAPGDIMSPLPLWGEVAHSIIEDTGEGIVVADGIANVVAPYGLKEPIIFKVKNGREYEIKGGDQAKKWEAVIKSADENANILCEFAIGTGHRERWNTVSEKGALGTIHLALGENAGPYPGGKSHSKVHLDVTLRHPTVEFDGKTVIEKGMLKID